jgi:hypothetical protein
MKTLKKFAHVNAKTVDEAAAILQRGKAGLMAGGTDLLGTMRFEVLPEYPEVVVNLKSIPGLDEAIAIPISSLALQRVELAPAVLRHYNKPPISHFGFPGQKPGLRTIP